MQKTLAKKAERGEENMIRGYLLSIYCSLNLFLLSFRSSHGFSVIPSKNVAVRTLSRLDAVVPKSLLDCRSDLIASTFKSLMLLPVACATVAAISINPTRAEDGEFDPLVQGIMDFGGTSIVAAPGDNFLVQVYDSSVAESPVLLAGAKLPFNDAVRMPFRFQLFKDNLMIPQKKWDEIGDFDQRVVVTLCRGPILKGGICNGDIIAKGEGVSKVVSIGSTADEVRGVRLFAFVKLKSS